MANTIVPPHQPSDVDSLPMGIRCPRNALPLSAKYKTPRLAAELADLRAHNTKSSELVLPGQLVSCRYIEIDLLGARLRDAEEDIETD
ncbi:hypothetical protein LZ554_004605 [Drepanopeziza brunnea f. sp. 'monogermtubi']|nr:hypothetical protein LZ554_004605 [Drepanopeziza brunnea f. sp. 'monogermtubi']